MTVAVLDETQKNSLVNVELQPNWYFNPVQDGNTPPNWVISLEEIDKNTNATLSWINILPQITWVAPSTTSGVEQ